jgi:hypothetical protein
MGIPQSATGNPTTVVGVPLLLYGNPTNSSGNPVTLVGVPLLLHGFPEILLQF